METISIISIISIAFIGSFGHCIGMCGGIVLAYSSVKINSNDSKKRQALMHLLYNFGRVTTYTFLGFIFGYLGSVLSFSTTSKGFLFFLTGLLMILIGFSLMGKIKFLTLLEQTFSKSPFYQKLFKKVLGSNSKFSFYLIGILNGFLPCGFVYMFAIMAASTGSAFYGAMVMFIFGVTTIFALFFVGFFAGLFKQSSFRDISMKIASILVILFGLYTAYNGFALLKNKTINIEHNHHMNTK
ncbi:sulfite exporter TauE/SafE family protein [Aliarcobacter skirrowii]|uniref:sulfite exporter TauE/SafE family protein n=1 Tax=Aliarcobacter skirrowii TaxID=28200 RepID=UPI0029BF47C0|nr:sulfite exporter TauE/SafE family protein [Aliarcobacter skirrowii]MDX4037346.1 sulfite exporter TauE/SafE family protein [Aliarcobacter skirrowii]